MRPLVVLVIVTMGAGAFFAGRGSVDRRPAPRSPAGGYAAGREAAFSGFDGGWSYGVPYIVTLRRGDPGVTYRFDRRWPMRRGVAYRVCGHVVCGRAAP